MRTFFNLLLVLILISCPLRCQLGWSDCCGQAQVAVESMEDCCCDTKRETPPPPVEPSEECKCICGGATMPDTTDFVSDDFSRALDCFVTCSVTWQATCGDMQSRRMKGDDGFPEFPWARNVGRQIRFLLGSLII